MGGPSKRKRLDHAGWIGRIYYDLVEKDKNGEIVIHESSHACETVLLAAADVPRQKLARSINERIGRGEPPHEIQFSGRGHCRRARFG